MKLLLLLSVVLCQLGRTVSKDPSTEEFASQLYEKASEQVASFFKTAGTPVTDFVHPSLRTEETEIHPRATAHFTYYKDSSCTQLDYILDYKISRCIKSFPIVRIRIVGEQDSTWTLTFDHYDDACENDLGMSDPMQTFPKNTCVPYGGAYVTFNLIAHPLKSIPGGGGAFVFYRNQDDCHISKHTNLGRAVTMITVPNGVCSTGHLGPVLGPLKTVSCDSTALTFDHFYDLGCTQLFYQNSYSTVQAESCPVGEPFPYQALCITDSGL
jgi:hypothetical protein